MARPGVQIRPDPNDKTIRYFDFRRFLGATGTILSHTETITHLSGTATPPVTLGSVTVISSTMVRVQIVGGAIDAKWQVSCKIVTNETPAREKEISLFVKPQNN